jgi:hypothetical protein
VFKRILLPPRYIAATSALATSNAFLTQAKSSAPNLALSPNASQKGARMLLSSERKCTTSEVVEKPESRRACTRSEGSRAGAAAERREVRSGVAENAVARAGAGLDLAGYEGGEKAKERFVGGCRGVKPFVERLAVESRVCARGVVERSRSKTTPRKSDVCS